MIQREHRRVLSRKQSPMHARAANNRLAEALADLAWPKEELAQTSHVSLSTVQRALEGHQASARIRARLVGAINDRRKAQNLAPLLASEVFPRG